MKNIVCLLSAVLCLGSLAKADTLKFVNSSNPSSDIGPYKMQLDGKSNVDLFCLDDLRTITPGESWQVSVVSGDQYYTTNTRSTDFKYEEEAYIYSMLGQKDSKGHTYTTTDVQEALWSIFDRHADTDKWADALIDQAGDFNYTKGFLDNYDFYIPTSWPFFDGEPQEMIGATPNDPPPAATPEPSTLLLMGSGLIGVAGAMRRRIAASISK